MQDSARRSSRVRGEAAGGSGLGERAGAEVAAIKRASRPSADERAAAAAGAAENVREEHAAGPGLSKSIVKATVKVDTTIKAFVEGALGIVPYVAGKGWHELKEDIPINVYTTEHILESPEGELLRGEEAKRACGVATVVRKDQMGGTSLPPGWALFLRSKSYGRKLRAGQRFIYDKG